MRFEIEQLDASDGEAGAPLLLPIDAIDEDPQQPRQEFDDATLDELAQTIRERGVRQPVSVRRHPQQEGRWLLNFGARRLRAARRAQLDRIPAFLDEAADGYDQVIENEQREPLKPLELALFVQRRLTAGDSQAEIARRLGKSKAYITMAAALIDAPDWLMAMYRSGRCRGLLELYELRRAHEREPNLVQRWATGRTTIGRDDVQRLNAELAGGSLPRPPVKPISLTLPSPSFNVVPGAETVSRQPPTRAKAEGAVPDHWLAGNGAVLVGRVGKQLIRVVLDDAPEDPGCIFVEGADACRSVVSAASIRLVRIVRSIKP